MSAQGNGGDVVRTIALETRRHWLNAYILEDWRRRLGPALRRSYKSNDDALTQQTYAEARAILTGWIASIDSVADPSRNDAGNADG